VDGQLISKIGRGLLVLAGVGRDDTEKDIDTMINRILKARLFPAETDKQVRGPSQDLYYAYAGNTVEKECPGY
jgi:D-tyrosyl-tRNA(Tyr) deacylase